MSMRGDSPLLQIDGLTVENDGRRSSRELALNISTLRIDRGERVLVLGDRLSGKSVLEDAVLATMKSPETRGEDLQLPNREGQTHRICVTRLFRGEDTSGRKQGGTTEQEIAALREVALLPDPSRILNYADDPQRPTEIVDIAAERGLSLMIANDPDRLVQSLVAFSRRGAGRVLWLREGIIFWDGAWDAFLRQADFLLQEYLRAQGEATRKFIEAIEQATGMLR